MLNKRRYRTCRIRHIIIEHISNNIIEYIAMFLILIVGIILGTIYINNSSVELRQEVVEYINGFLEDTHSGSQINLNSLLKTSISNNLIIIIILWLSGMTVIGMPIIYITVSIKGFCIGYTISAIIGSLGNWKGIQLVLSTMFLQNIIMIPSILVLAVSGIKLYKSIIKDKRRENIKFGIFKYTIITIIIGIISIFAGLIETYISSNIFKLIFI